MKKVVLFLLLLLVAVGLRAQCIETIGFSVPSSWWEWFEADERIDDSEWQLTWASGAGHKQWANDLTWGRSETRSDCVGPITQVVFNVASTGCSLDVSYHEMWTEAALEQIFTRYPGVPVIVQPTIGGPNHEMCPTPNGKQSNCRDFRSMVKESVIAPYVTQALMNIAASDPRVSMGPVVTVDSCADFGDHIGHLVRENDDVWPYATYRMATHFADFYGDGIIEPPPSLCENEAPDQLCNWIGAGETYATCPEDCPPCGS